MSGFSLRELNKINNQLERMSEYAHNKKIGYEPKCKICNSKYQIKIEAAREEGCTLEEIRDYLEGKDEEVSIMSLSRHFERHYPKRREYLRGIDEEKAKTILEGEKRIEQDIKYDPEFLEELESEHTIYGFDDNGEYKGVNKKGRDIYIFDNGYCITAARFCELVPKLQRMAGGEVTDHFKSDIFMINSGLVSDWMGEKKTKLLENSLKCTNCQLFYNECVTHGLLNLVLNDKYGFTLEMEEFNNILYENDYVPEDVEEELQRIASQKEEKATENP